MKKNDVLPQIKQRKKFQVFVSSTFLDLKNERQAAVEAILQSGHIPAGMELFTAGDRSQLEVIKEWIKQSDIYMLILGPRYGAIEPESQKSYTQLEYELAIEQGIPIFSVIISDSHLKERMSEYASDENELKNREKYFTFSKLVKNRMCEFFSDCKDIKIAIFKSIKEIEYTQPLKGWVSGDFVSSIEAVSTERDLLMDEVRNLKNELEAIKSNPINDSEERLYNGLTYEELEQILKKENVKVPDFKDENNPPVERNMFLLFKNMADMSPVVTNSSGSSKASLWVFEIATKFLKYKLTEYHSLPETIKWQKIGVSELGYRFAAETKKRTFLGETNKKTIKQKKVTKKK